eukprot:Tamp_18462.p2 GENE.Tamp_18462~~Tamp_18462.p2  ORF type:complete len:307 (+),score=24.66 Tamp_18462:119-922(+)
MHYQGQAAPSLSAPHYFPQFARPQLGDFGAVPPSTHYGRPAPNQPGHQEFNQNFRGGHPRGRGRGRGWGGGFEPGDWTCPGCNAKVFASRSECFRCSTPRPHGMPGRGYGGGRGLGNGGFSGPFSGGPPRREGDWTCPTCSANVFATRSECFRCQTPKPGGAGAGASASVIGGGRGFAGKRGGYNGGFVGPFSGGPPRREGDWTCPTCSANVYATRTACFRCNAPKPATAAAEDASASAFGEASAFENQQMDSRAGLPAGGVIAANR